MTTPRRSRAFQMSSIVVSKGKGQSSSGNTLAPKQDANRTASPGDDADRFERSCPLIDGERRDCIASLVGNAQRFAAGIERHETRYTSARLRPAERMQAVCVRIDGKSYNTVMATIGGIDIPAGRK